MKFEDALENFKNEIIQEYDAENVIIKIELTPKFMDIIAAELIAKYRYFTFGPYSFSEISLNGVDLAHGFKLVKNKMIESK